MKIVLGDTHLGLYKSSDLWHEVVIDLFEEIHYKCIKNNIDTIIHLGDFFDNRKLLNGKTFEISEKISEILSPFTTYIITGNHDTFYKDRIKPSFLDIFKHQPHIKVVDSITKIDDITLVPWMTNTENIEGKYLFGHFEINGFKMNDGYECSKGVSYKDFKNFDKVFSGHFHIASEDKNIKYIGTPFQQNFGDVGLKKGYYLFEDGEMEFVEFNKGPKFIKIHTENLLLEDVENNIIKVIFDKDYGTNENEKIINDIMIKNPLQLYTDFSGISNEAKDEVLDDNVCEILDHNEIFIEYLKKSTLPENIKIKNVLNILKTLIEETKN